MIREAFEQLYPQEPFTYHPRLRYSSAFHDYNANVKLRGTMLIFSLSRTWKTISRDIQIGLIQSLMVKLFRKKARTVNMDMYEIFMKRIHIAAPKHTFEPELKESFNRVNAAYFSNLLEMPNLVWGSDSARKLGSYAFGSDTITLSIILVGKGELLDYVMYHEMLHKKFKFTTKNARSFHHTKEFKDAEKQFLNAPALEKELKKLIHKKRFWSFFT